MQTKILHVEFPIGILKLGDSIQFKEIKEIPQKGDTVAQKAEGIFQGIISSFEIGTNIMQGTHEIIVVCNNIKFIKSSIPCVIFVESIVKAITVRLEIDPVSGETIEHILQEMNYNFSYNPDGTERIIETEITDQQVISDLTNLANTYAVFANGDEYTCRSIFDTDKTPGDGIEITLASTQQIIGVMYGISIPDVEEADETETEQFESRVREYIENL